MTHAMPERSKVSRALPTFAHGMLRLGPEGMPAAADPLLATAGQDLWGSRLWYDTVLRHALPPGSRAWLAFVGPTGTMAVPLLDASGRLGSLTTPYTLTWRPLIAAWAGPEAVEAAAAQLGEVLRRKPPVLLRAIRAEDPWLDALCTGLRRAGLMAQRFDHFGNCFETLPAGISWDDYEASREQPLLSVLRRKRESWAAGTRFEQVQWPGAALEAGIAAYEAVRARSWNPREPAPGFTVALMRAAAAAGILRLGVLHTRQGGRPLAAQCWILSGGQARAISLVHDEAERHLSPGTGLTARMVESLIREGVNAIDFGRGDDAYKRLWARERWQRVGLLVADPRNAAGIMAIARHVAGRGRRRLFGLFGHRSVRDRGR